MSIIYYNPYFVLGQQHKDGLDAIIAALPTPPPNPTIEAIITATNNFVGPLYGDDLSAIELLELSIIESEAINGYINATSGGYFNFTPLQQKFIFQMIEGLKNEPLESYGEYLINLEENITTSGLSTSEQGPLLIATSIGKADYEYWLAQVGASGSWDPYITAEVNSPLRNMAYIVGATMEGTLIAAKSAGLRNASLGSLQGPGMSAVSALSASIVLAAGKVILKWLPRVAEVK